MEWTEADRYEFVEHRLRAHGIDPTPEAVADARATEWDDDSIDMALSFGG